MKILLLNDTVDLENWGAQAGVDALKQIIYENIPNASVVSLTYQWIAKRYFISPRILGSQVFSKGSAILRRFSKEFQFLPLVSDEYEFIAKQWLRGGGGPQAKEYLEKLKSVNAIVFNAEGSVYRNNYTAMKALFLLWLAKKHFSIPVFFLNGSVHITRVDPILPAMVGRTFEVLDGIAVREPYSLRNIGDYFPDMKVELIPDSAFYLSNDLTNQVSKKFNNIKRRLENTAYFCISMPILITKIRNYYRQPPDEAALVQIIRELKRLVPQAVLMAKEPSGRQFLQQITKDTDSLFFGPEYSYNDLMALLSNAKFLVSGRYHHIILASLVGCPSIPLASSSHKIHGLCELFDGAIGDPHDSTYLQNEMHKIITEVDVILRDELTKRCLIKETANKLRKQTNRLGEILKTTITLQ